MPALSKMIKIKKSTKTAEPTKPRQALDESNSTTEADFSDDFFFSMRRVRFSACITQHTVMNTDNYSESERKLCWYDKEDKAEMNKKHDKIVRRYEKGKPCKRGMTYRGLDVWTDKGQDKFEETIERLLDAVIDEQDDQWLRDYIDTDRLARASRSISKRDVRHALEVARVDEIEAREAYKSDFKEALGSEDEDFSSRSTRTALLGKKKKHRRRDTIANMNSNTENDGKKKSKRKSKRRTSSKNKSDK